ncbi:hypothetical protein HDU96_009721 [Phlyctochytrium bullatum]|nr:hypothetical protein HDU96_009721 [Phlyctochytrium bullatum]
MASYPPPRPSLTAAFQSVQPSQHPQQQHHQNPTPHPAAPTAHLQPFQHSNSVPFPVDVNTPTLSNAYFFPASAAAPTAPAAIPTVTTFSLSPAPGHEPILVTTSNTSTHAGTALRLGPIAVGRGAAVAQPATGVAGIVGLVDPLVFPASTPAQGLGSPSVMAMRMHDTQPAFQPVFLQHPHQHLQGPVYLTAFPSHTSGGTMLIVQQQPPQQQHQQQPITQLLSYEAPAAMTHMIATPSGILQPQRRHTDPTLQQLSAQAADPMAIHPASPHLFNVNLTAMMSQQQSPVPQPTFPAPTADTTLLVAYTATASPTLQALPAVTPRHPLTSSHLLNHASSYTPSLLASPVPTSSAMLLLPQQQSTAAATPPLSATSTPPMLYATLPAPLQLAAAADTVAPDVSAVPRKRSSTGAVASASGGGPTPTLATRRRIEASTPPQSPLQVDTATTATAAAAAAGTTSRGSFSSTTSTTSSDGPPPPTTTTTTAVVVVVDDPPRPGHLACPHPGCPRTFTRRSNLKSHSVLHDPDRGFACDACSATFRRGHDLLRHVRARHSNVRPHRCVYCPAAFARADALKKHLDYERREREAREAGGGGSGVGVDGEEQVGDEEGEEEEAAVEE